MKLVYITPCKHHVVLEGNGQQVGLLSITHVSDAKSHFVINKVYEVCKKSIEEKGLSDHFIFLANFCSLQDNSKQ